MFFVPRTAFLLGGLSTSLAQFGATAKVPSFAAPPPVVGVFNQWDFSVNTNSGHLLTCGIA